MANTQKIPKPVELPVIELFGPTIQGEGAMAGQRSHFVRFGGCSYRCSWCDSMHAVDPELIKKNKTMMTPSEIVSKLEGLKPSNWVTLSGGDPGMHNLYDLMREFMHSQFKVALETQGAFWKAWMDACDHITVSPKPPSSGEQDKINYDVLEAFIKHSIHGGDGNPITLCFKVVCLDDKDLQWARKLHKKYPEVPFYLSVCTDINNEAVGKDNMTNEWLQQQICSDLRSLFNAALKYKDLADVTIMPQLHVLAWGTQLGK